MYTLGDAAGKLAPSIGSPLRVAQAYIAGIPQKSACDWISCINQSTELTFEKFHLQTPSSEPLTLLHNELPAYHTDIISQKVSSQLSVLRQKRPIKQTLRQFDLPYYRTLYMSEESLVRIRSGQHGN